VLVTLVLLAVILPGLAAPAPAGEPPPAPTPPNVVLILADDLGWGDLASYGSRLVRTPSLDRMADEGIRLTAFHSASAVCSPSRAALLTGRYPVRTGVLSVYYAESRRGLPPEEITLAEALRELGYATAVIGKWHLGSEPAFLPTNQGFDEFLGIPFGADMSPPLLEGARTIERRPDPSTLLETFTSAAVRFIDGHAEGPFFLLLAHSLPHRPFLVPEGFRGKSAGGPYGDAVEAIDWSVGEVMAALRRRGLDGRTLVIFSSDNGPDLQGSTGGLRERKDSAYEGGLRVPFLARWPGRVPEGIVSGEPVSALDLFPTVLAAAGAGPPARLVLDGGDVLPLLTGRAATREPLLTLYFQGPFLRAARWTRWKLHVARRPPGEETRGAARVNRWLAAPELFDLSVDAEEAYDVAPIHADVVADLKRRIRAQMETLPEPIREKNSVAMSY
jgi:arylsulfatase A-like enzyme